MYNAMSQSSKTPIRIASGFCGLMTYREQCRGSPPLLYLGVFEYSTSQNSLWNLAGNDFSSGRDAILSRWRLEDNIRSMIQKVPLSGALEDMPHPKRINYPLFALLYFLLAQRSRPTGDTTSRVDTFYLGNNLQNRKCMEVYMYVHIHIAWNIRRGVRLSSFLSGLIRARSRVIRPTLS